MDFEKIEDLFPDGAFTIGSGHTCVSAQWLHDFAKNIAAAEREACAAKVEGNHGWVDGVYFDDLGAALRNG